MLNHVILQGNLGNAPQFKKTKEGKDIAFLSIATSFSWKGPNGEWNKRVDWHRVTVFNEQTVTWMKEVLKKGDGVFVMGTLKYRGWTDKRGQSHVDAHVFVNESEGLVVHIPVAKAISTSQTIEPIEDNNTQSAEGESL